ncbi:hypothetical protein [Aquimarina aquimarini]|uniref:hypothetical protein n=1 Tax=Aquimarina aquimarini TaxID=1191734 RepID=UPI000D556F61|nr:hypothetical protein [Aquimarina aquimarini]
MTFTTKTYTATDDTYDSLATTIIEETTSISEDEHSQSLADQVAEGIKKQLRYKKVTSGDRIKLISNAEFYLNMVNTATASYVKRATRNATTVNNLATTPPHLFFAVAEYNDYKDYAWKHKEYQDNEGVAYFRTENGHVIPFVSKKRNETIDAFVQRRNQIFTNCQREIISGKLGTGVNGINGDKTQAKKAKKGCIYIFDENNELKHTFVIKDSKYQEVQLSQTDYSYRKKIGIPQECAKISNFFAEDNETLKKYQFVYSPIKLSKKRLFGTNHSSILPEFDTTDSARHVNISKYGLCGLNDDNRSGSEILTDYQHRNRELPPAIHYHLSSTLYKNIGTGVVIHYPNPLEELKRRAKVFQKRFKDREAWIQDENRSGQYFLHQAITAMIDKNPTMKARVNVKRMDNWKYLYDKEYKKINDKMLSGIINLIEWLRSPELIQTVYNYATSTDKVHLVEATEAYGEACRFIGYTIYGKEFLEAELQDTSSFLCLINGLNSNVRSSEDFLAQYGVLLRDDVMNQDRYTAIGMTTRKAEQALVNILDTSAPTIGKVFGNKAVAKIAKRLGKIIAQFDLTSKRVKPIDTADTIAEIIDNDPITKFLNSKGLKGLIGVFEIYNLIIAIKTLQDDPEHSANNIFGLVGASADLVAENYGWLLQTSQKYIKSNNINTLLANKTTVIAPLMVVSGIIDCMIGTNSAIDAHRKGELKLRDAYVSYALGGALVAFGAATMVAGGKTAALSVGTASIPATAMISSGIVISLVGLTLQYWWDDEKIKKWLKHSIFGDDADIFDLPIFEGINKASAKEVSEILFSEKFNRNEKAVILTEIKTMNDIMFEFFVAGKIHQEEHGDTRRMASGSDPRLPGLSDQAKTRIQRHRLPNKYTTIAVDIEPGLMTPNATITFSNLKKHSINRFVERFDPYQINNEAEYTKQLPDISLSMQHPEMDTSIAGRINYKQMQVTKDARGRVININKIFIFKNEDIDKLTGDITIDFKRNSKQIITKSFSIEI